MKLRERALALSGITLLCLVPSGCLGVVAGAAGAYGYVKYAANEFARDFDASLDEGYAAARFALESQGYPPFELEELRRTDGELRTEDAHVTVERHPGGVVRIRVRVGTFETDENQRRAELLLEDVAKRLGG